MKKTRKNDTKKIVRCCDENCKINEKNIEKAEFLCYYYNTFFTNLRITEL